MSTCDEHLNVRERSLESYDRCVVGGRDTGSDRERDRDAVREILLVLYSGLK